MPDVFEEQAVLIAAEQAAAEGDAIAAEGHLRKLLFLQTARLGPEHQDVASTVHNLAVVCERAGRLGEAEYLYRRAHAVASAVLPPTDPLVIRCQEDLTAFLGARSPAAQAGVGDPAPAASVAGRSTPASGVRKPSPSSASRTPARPPSKVRPPAPPSPEPRPVLTRTTMARIGVAVLAVLGLAWTFLGRSATPPAEPAPIEATTPARRPAPAPAKKPAAPAPARPAATAVPAPPPAATPAPTPPPTASAPTEGRASTPPPAPAESSPPADAASTGPPSASANSGAITVTDARLCSDLSTSGRWRCTAPGQPATPGRMAFLTRLAVPSAMQVEHRWYFGSELIRAVSLRVPPAGVAGYRTYSRQVIDAARTGDWHVELRGPDGAVLAEERFTVQ